jgi:hypothetical protein
MRCGYQLKDSGAKALICQGRAVREVAKSGVELDLVVVTNVGRIPAGALKRSDVEEEAK